jgi:hypothetical protein
MCLVEDTAPLNVVRSHTPLEVLNPPTAGKSSNPLLTGWYCIPTLALKREALKECRQKWKTYYDVVRDFATLFLLEKSEYSQGKCFSSLFSDI